MEWVNHKIQKQRDVKIHRDIVAPFMLNYFNSVLDPKFDQIVFNDKYKELVEIISRDYNTSKTICPILNLDISDNIYEIDKNIIIRKLEDEEIEKWINPGNYNDDHLVSNHNISSIFCCIEINQPYKKFEEIGLFGHMEFADKLTTLINLFKDSYSLVLFTEDFRIGPSAPYSTGSSINYEKFNPRNDRITVLDRNDIQALKSLWEKLLNGPNSSLLKLAFSRWANASHHTYEIDNLIDYWIGLESLFTPDSKQE